MCPTSSTSNASGGKLYELKTFGSYIVGWQSPWFGGIMDDFVPKNILKYRENLH